MPKRHRHKKTKGGDLSSWWSDNVSNSSWLNRSKSYLPSWMSGDSSQSSTGMSNMGFDSTSSNNSSSLNFGTTNGGKKTKRKYGGYKSNTPTTGLASSASPVSGIQTAKPHTWVGGKTKRRHKHSRTCKHKKH